MNLLNKSIIYIAINFLLRFLVVVNSQITISKPDLRIRHTATLINDKLYILGGSIINSGSNIPKERFLYIDFSSSFNTNKLRWVDLSDNNIINSATAVKGGTNNHTLFFYGGQSEMIMNMMTLVYTFDTQNNSWSTPEITGIPPTGKFDITAIIDYNGLIYLFGGSFANDMFILDSINLRWKQVSSTNAPSPRNQYNAVFLPNKHIIYMGGFNGNEVFSLNEVYLYDTVNDNWTNQITTGLIPSTRSSFSSVLGLDGQRIIIFGGINNNATNKSPENSLYALDLNNFNWYIPKISGKIPSNRAFHKAVIIGKYMVITFGEGYVQGNENDILLLDISNNDEYIWTTTFEHLSLTSSTPTLNTNVVAFIGSLIGCGILLAGSFFAYEWYKNRKGQNKTTSTSEDERDHSSEKKLQTPEEKKLQNLGVIQQIIPNQFVIVV